MKQKIFIFFLTFNLAFSSYAAPPKNFTQAKKIVKQIFKDHRLTLYCNCKYDNYGKINHKSCNMQPIKHMYRANRLEFEHIMPMSSITKQFKCGREKICIGKSRKKYSGRACCRKINPKYRKIEAELFNLWPVVGSINRERLDYRFTKFSSKVFTPENFFDNCPILIDDNLRAVEPRDEIKGLVARASLFMAKKYDIKLSKQQENLFNAWNKKYPPDEWELTWAKRITEITGYPNEFIFSDVK